jgi:hypothetical protein
VKDTIQCNNGAGTVTIILFKWYLRYSLSFIGRFPFHHKEEYSITDFFETRVKKSRGTKPTASNELLFSMESFSTVQTAVLAGGQ